MKSQSVQKRLRKAVDLHISGNLEAAEELYLSVIHDDKRNSLALTNLATLYKAKGALDAARELFEQAIGLGHSSPDLLHNYAGLLCSLEDYDTAIDLERKAICLNPDSHDQHTRLGFCLWKVGCHEEARLCTRKAIDLNGQSITALRNMGCILRDQKQLDKALEYTRRALALNPRCCESLENAGVILLDLFRPEEAFEHLLKAFELNPNSSGLLVQLARALGELSKFEQALGACNKAIEIYPKNANAYNMRSIILNRLNYIPQAIESARTALSLDTGNLEARINLGNYLRTRGELDEALQHVQAALEIDHDLSSAHCIMGCILLSKGNFEAATKAFFRSINSDEPCCGGFFHLSQQAKGQLVDELLDLIERVQGSSFSPQERTDLEFAKSNLYVKKKHFQKSEEHLKLANSLKLSYYPTDKQVYIKSAESLGGVVLPIHCEYTSNRQHIFIVGMPRSGSTLTESILSLNQAAQYLGETKALVNAYQQWERNATDREKESLLALYEKEISTQFGMPPTITIDKNLYNYRYASIICSQISNARIIHCFRHPLDNILSLHRAHFANASRYASSIEDCAHVLLSQHDIMEIHRARFPSRIYSQDYDRLVSNHDDQIRLLIKWLQWEWDDTYLHPHKNKRAVNTASVVQVRSPINNKSLGGWKNFLSILAPAVKVLSNHKDYLYIQEEFDQANSAQR